MYRYTVSLYTRNVSFCVIRHYCGDFTQKQLTCSYGSPTKKQPLINAHTTGRQMCGPIFKVTGQTWPPAVGNADWLIKKQWMSDSDHTLLRGRSNSTASVCQEKTSICELVGGRIRR